MRRVYIISDLHLGGDYPRPGERSTRGFRLCTHPDAIASFVDAVAQEVEEQGPRELILNGDTVDFLAERDSDSGSWSPFTGDPDQAVEKLRRIVKRDQQVFASLNGFLEKGGGLTLLLGNHDIELSLPPVRDALKHALGVKASHEFKFIYDGEAYVIGDALIEHGNRYDAWNQIDLDALRRVRSLVSRRQNIPRDYNFAPPAGSEMVSSVINRIKPDYPFVDLLKPEEAAVIPILLALEPDYRKRLGRIALLAYRTRYHGLKAPALPAFGGDIRAESDSATIEFGEDMVASPRSRTSVVASDEDEALKRAIQDALGDQADSFFSDIRAATDGDDEVRRIGEDISFSDNLDRAQGFFGLLFSRKSESVEKRMPALLKAMRSLQNQNTFKTDVETEMEYLEAAQELVGRGFRYVVFGHTHKAKHVNLGEGRFYLNSGTWADVLQFPVEILTSPETEALDRLQAFVDYLTAGDFSSWTLFNPTYVRFDLDDSDTITNAELKTASSTIQP
jgi:UDP-2,3-diacylglucosamine pyrophosphatase LpxH